MTASDDLVAVEVQAVRRRQLTNAALHGSSRSWTAVRRRFPAVLAGVVLAALLLMAVLVIQVVRAQLATNRHADGPRPTQQHGVVPDPRDLEEVTRAVPANTSGRRPAVAGA